MAHLGIDAGQIPFRGHHVLRQEVSGTGAQYTPLHLRRKLTSEHSIIGVAGPRKLSPDRGILVLQFPNLASPALMFVSDITPSSDAVVFLEPADDGTSSANTVRCPLHWPPAASVLDLGWVPRCLGF